MSRPKGEWVSGEANGFTCEQKQTNEQVYKQSPGRGTDKQVSAGRTDKQASRLTCRQIGEWMNGQMGKSAG